MDFDPISWGTRWIFNKALDGTSRGIAKFSEPVSGLFNSRFLPTHLKLKGDALYKFYLSEQAYSASIAGQKFFFPASLVRPSREHGDLQKQRIRIEVNEEIYELNSYIDELTKPLLPKLERSSVVDIGRPWRIQSSETVGGELRLVCQRCNYVDSVRTNFSMDYPTKGGKTLRQVVHGQNHNFEEFSLSRLPNHMGVVVIVESKDGKVVVQKRSKNVAIRPSTLSASVSGTVELSDLVSRSRIGDISGVFGAAVREAFEELRVDLDEAKFIGLFREFLRGGVPEFYFFARSRNTFAEIVELAQFADGKKEISSITSVPFHSEHFLADPTREKYNFEGRVADALKGLSKNANLTITLGLLSAAQLLIESAAD